MMKLAFVLFHYFPYGGLERDMLAIASACAAKGHEVIIYTRHWQGARPANMAIREISVHGFTNHGRATNFAKSYQQALIADPVDLVIGFNKMPGLDIYFAADICFAQKAFEEKSWLYRQTSRCRHFLALENSVFGRHSKTQVMIISPAQIPPLKHYYQTPDNRLHILTPGIRRDRVMPDNYWELRKTLRLQYGLVDDNYVLLTVGSDFRRKGVDLAIRALAALPVTVRQRARLWVAGQDDPQRFIKLAEELGVSEQLVILGARDDVPQLMWAADMFLHPAYSEAAGAVLLEAVVAGLPVVATDVCGYADYIRQMQMGQIVSIEEAKTRLADIIVQLAVRDASQWRDLSRQAVQDFDIFSMVDHAVHLIESVGQDSDQFTINTMIIKS
jgi:UDP-glucose:(heptosyl)LPS alpha-1,3-glucosyltransferase